MFMFLFMPLTKAKPLHLWSASEVLQLMGAAARSYEEVLASIAADTVVLGDTSYVALSVGCANATLQGKTH